MNTNLIGKLTPADKVPGIYAYLVDELNNAVFNFLYNPEEKTFSRVANYSEGVAALTSVPSQQYNYTSGLVLSLDNLLLESYSEGKTCKSLIQDIQKLMVADPAVGKYLPSPVSFVWGKDKFGPAVITDLKWKETLWLNGEVAAARLSFNLLEIPQSQIPSKVNSQTTQGKIEASIKNGISLTEREKQEAISKSKSWLSANKKKIKDTYAALVTAGKYKISVSDAGVVTLIDLNNTVLGTIGVFRTGKLNTSTNTLSKTNL